LLRRVQLDLSSETRNHGLSRLQEARVAVDNGGGENDLKRLQRKFQATKASYINVDVKERFMQSEGRCQSGIGAAAHHAVPRDSCARVCTHCQAHTAPPTPPRA
jgi:hypothetical protein